MNGHAEKELIFTPDGQSGMKVVEFDGNGDVISTEKTLPLQFETQRLIAVAIAKGQQERRESITKHPLNQFLRIFGLPCLSSLRG